MIQKLEADPVIAEIHRIRQEISDRFAGNISAIAEDAARRQAAAGRPIWQAKREEPLSAPKATTDSAKPG